MKWSQVASQLFPSEASALRSRLYLTSVAFSAIIALSSIIEVWVGEWPIFSSNPVFWSLIVFLIGAGISCSVDLPAQTSVDSMSYAIHFVSLFGSILWIKPFALLVYETVQCNSATDQQRNAYTACINGFPSQLVDRQMKNACLLQTRIDVSVMGTGTCPWTVATNSAAIIALEFIFLALVLLVLLYAAWIGIVMAKKYTRGVAVAQATARLAPSSGGPPKGAN
jgi:hypothetical protein